MRLRRVQKAFFGFILVAVSGFGMASALAQTPYDGL